MTAASNRNNRKGNISDDGNSLASRIAEKLTAPKQKHSKRAPSPDVRSEESVIASAVAAEVLAKTKRRSNSCNCWTWAFVIGAVATVLGAGIPKAAQTPAVSSALSDSVLLLNSTLFEKLNVSLDGLSQHFNSLQVLTNFSSMMGPSDPTRPGQLAYKEGLRPKHPVFIIPGFVTSGLELWQGRPCAAGYFRQNLWGTLTMAQTMIADKDCWLQHMMLDPETGSDPPGIKLRAKRSLEAVDFFIQGYWVFNKMIRAFADIGYDSNNMIAVPYDWRLPIPLMESRDGYFTLLKTMIELQVRFNGEKALLVSHSYGVTVTLSFLAWVSREEPTWVETYVETYANVAGSILGVPKALPPVLSGETRELSDLALGMAFLADQYLPKASRAALARSWGSCMAMLPMGGKRVWGNDSWAPDDTPALRRAGRSLGTIIARVYTPDASVRENLESNKVNDTSVSKENRTMLNATLHHWHSKLAGANKQDKDDQMNSTHVHLLDVEEMVEAVARVAGAQFAENMAKWSSVGMQRKEMLDRIVKELKAKQHKHGQQHEQEKEDLGGERQRQAKKESAAQQEHTPTKEEETRTPAMNARDRGEGGNQPETLGTLYDRITGAWTFGRGEAKPNTVRVADPTEEPLPQAPSFKLYCLYGVGVPSDRAFHYVKSPAPRNSAAANISSDEDGVWTVNSLANDPDTGLEGGIQLADGDGTVPTLSMGALCEGGWKTSKRLNPAGVKVVTREYEHKPVAMFKDPRGGPGASTHVEILGNDELLRDVLALAAGRPDLVKPRIFSKIKEMAAAIDWDSDGKGSSTADSSIGSSDTPLDDFIKTEL